MLNLDYEEKLFSLGYENIAAFDEVGRGPLAGPVVAACVLINPEFKINTEDLKIVKDSKKLSAKNREKAFKAIKASVLELGIGVLNHKAIDRVNILQASFLAMDLAFSKLKNRVDFVLVDGNLKVPQIKKPQRAIINGDSLVFSIAAASIIAKVSRDYIMEQAHLKYPQYNFAKNKGYGTKEHLAMIKKYGPCPIHRLSFSPFSGNKKN